MLHVFYVKETHTAGANADDGDKNMKKKQRQNLTISLDPQIIHKAKVLAAQRSTSISGLVADQIEILIAQGEAYERAKRQAIILLDRGFHLGGVIRANRDELHER